MGQGGVHNQLCSYLLFKNKPNKYRTLFYELRFSSADGGQNFPKIAIKAQTPWPKFADIIN